MGQEAATDVSRAIAAWGRAAHAVRLSRFPDELWAVDIAVFLPLCCQGTAWRAAVGGVLPRNVTLSITTWHGTPEGNTHAVNKLQNRFPRVTAFNSESFLRVSSSRLPDRSSGTTSGTNASLPADDTSSAPKCISPHSEKAPFAVTFGLIKMSRASSCPRLPPPAELRFCLIILSLLMTAADGSRGGGNSWLQTDTGWTLDYTQGHVGLTLRLHANQNVKRSVSANLCGTRRAGSGRWGGGLTTAPPWNILS